MQLLARPFFLLSHFSRKVANRLSKGDKWRKIIHDWKNQKGETHLRLKYNQLQKDSVVFDLGGYEGQWASDIFSMYQCKVFVFEPVASFAENIRKRFEKNDNICVFQYGLADENKEVDISLEENSSSVFKIKGDLTRIELRQAKDFITTNKIEQIDLMKINIEGAEYDLLDHLIQEQIVKKIVNLQIQFHDFVPDAESRMKRIQNLLSETHEPTYQFEFLWENWKLKDK